MPLLTRAHLTHRHVHCEDRVGCRGHVEAEIRENDLEAVSAELCLLVEVLLRFAGANHHGTLGEQQIKARVDDDELRVRGVGRSRRADLDNVCGEVCQGYKVPRPEYLLDARMFLKFWSAVRGEVKGR